MKASLSLVNRVSLFFLVTLALVLAGYSVVLFAVLRHQLRLQFDDQLRGAFNTLAAAIEVDSDEVKFKPSDQTLTLGSESGGSAMRWSIYDERGVLVGRSRNLRAGSPQDDALLTYGVAMHSTEGDVVDLGQWRVLQQRLAATDTRSHDDHEPDEHEALVITVASSPDELHATLRLLGGPVILLPLAVMALVAIVGRRICRQALQPVRDMAAGARAMSQGEVNRRLAIPATRDELAELGAAFNAVLDRLFESLERRRRFAGAAAHQLRTPLAAVLGQLDVALRRPRTTDEYRETLSVVRDQATELRQIVESLLFLARSANDAILPDAERIRLPQWLPGYVAHWRDNIRFADLTLDMHADVAGEILALPVLLTQLLDNLLGNAFKYSQPGTPVRLELTRDHDQIKVTVIDKGIGVAAEDRQAIFEPFFRSGEARRSGVAGTGLGLAVAARIARALGGHLSCHSELHHGSRFTFSLPVTAAPNSPPTASDTAQNADAAPASGKIEYPV